MEGAMTTARMPSASMGSTAASVTGTAAWFSSPPRADALIAMFLLRQPEPVLTSGLGVD